MPGPPDDLALQHNTLDPSSLRRRRAAVNSIQPGEDIVDKLFDRRWTDSDQERQTQLISKKMDLHGPLISGLGEKPG